MLDAERRFGDAMVVADDAQFAGAAEFPLDEIAENRPFELEAALGVVADEVVGYAHGEAVVPALHVEPKQVGAKSRLVARPKFADVTRAGRLVAHGTLSCRSAECCVPVGVPPDS